MAKLMNNIQFDNALEAMNYYEQVFGAEILGRSPMTKEMAEAVNYTGELENTTVYGYFNVLGNMILCSDNYESKSTYSDQLSMVLDFNTDLEEEMENLESLYANVSKDEKTLIVVPLAEQAWGGKMAIFKDAYGITWMLHAQSYQQMGM